MQIIIILIWKWSESTSGLSWLSKSSPCNTFSFYLLLYFSFKKIHLSMMQFCYIRGEKLWKKLGIKEEWLRSTGILSWRKDVGLDGRGAWHLPRGGLTHAWMAPEFSKSASHRVHKTNQCFGAPGWFSLLSVWLRLRSWSHGSWVWAPHLTAQSLEPAWDSESPSLSLSAPPLLTLSLSLKNNK